MTRRLVPGLLCLFLALSVKPGFAQSAGLSFFKNYFHTGSHIAAGVSLKGTGVNGFATGDIWIGDNPNTPQIEPGVPEGAEVVAAYVYWMTVTSRSGNGAAGAKFNDGVLLPDDSAINGDISVIAKNLNPNGTAPCWSTGGATGDGGDARVVKTYRADVLPFLPPGPDGRRSANGKHIIKVPDMGTGNAVPAASGATLLVLYRLAGAPLAATVIYDGGFTLNQANPMLTLPLRGWYQSLTTSAGAAATLTQWAANGQSNFGERMTVKDANQSVLYQVDNPLVGGSGGPWDTFPANFTLPSGSASASVTVERGGTTGSFDCVSWGGFALTAPVQDTDFDGILDILESQSTSGTISDRAEIFSPTCTRWARGRASRTSSSNSGS